MALLNVEFQKIYNYPRIINQSKRNNPKNPKKQSAFLEKMFLPNFLSLMVIFILWRNESRNLVIIGLGAQWRSADFHGLQVLSLWSIGVTVDHTVSRSTLVSSARRFFWMVSTMIYFLFVFIIMRSIALLIYSIESIIIYTNLELLYGTWCTEACWEEEEGG